VADRPPRGANFLNGQVHRRLVIEGVALGDPVHQRGPIEAGCALCATRTALLNRRTAAVPDKVLTARYN